MRRVYTCNMCDMRRASVARACANRCQTGNSKNRRALELYTQSDTRRAIEVRDRKTQRVVDCSMRGALVVVAARALD